VIDWTPHLGTLYGAVLRIFEARVGSTRVAPQQQHGLHPNNEFFNYLPAVRTHAARTLYGRGSSPMVR
jgi:hypothetical protein